MNLSSDVLQNAICLGYCFFHNWDENKKQKLAKLSLMRKIRPPPWAHNRMDDKILQVHVSWHASKHTLWPTLFFY